MALSRRLTPHHFPVNQYPDHTHIRDFPSLRVTKKWLTQMRSSLAWSSQPQSRIQALQEVSPRDSLDAGCSVHLLTTRRAVHPPSGLDDADVG